MIRVVVISPERIDEAFPQIFSWVKDALGVDKGYLPEDIREECKSGVWELRLVYKEDALTGFFISTIIHLPRMKLFYGAWLGGIDLQDWVMEGFESIKKYAKESGCGAYSFVGREAWKKMIKCDYQGMYYYINL